MKIEATAMQIRALLELTERNVGEHEIPRPLLERYHWLLAAGRSPAVVPMERGVCSGCHVRLPTMFEAQAGRSLALYTCPHCRRLLYAQELLGPDPEAPPARSPGAPKSARRRS